MQLDFALPCFLRPCPSRRLRYPTAPHGRNTERPIAIFVAAPRWVTYITFTMSPIQISLFLTAAFIVVGVLAKTLARSDFSLDDLYLGMESGLAALSGSAIYAFDLGRQLAAVPDTDPDFVTKTRELANVSQLNIGFLVWALIAVFVTATIQMKWNRTGVSAKRRFLANVLLANIVGLGTLAGFILWVKQG